MSVYTENGFKNRRAYLEGIAEDYGLPYGTVAFVASIYGPEEDFDALITTLEDLDGVDVLA